MEPEKVLWKNLAMAIVVCAGLGALAALAPLYPCGYWETGELYADGGFAGYGHHSLVKVLGAGFFWTDDSVPEPYENFDGDAPFHAVGQWYVSLLYTPIFLAIACLGWLIYSGALTRPSRKSAELQG